jgi:hypothetical protein
LATGELFASLGYSFLVGKSTVLYIVNETSKVVWGKLQAKYMPVPNKHDWDEISKVFFEKCYVPNCIGSIGGKHCRLKCPAKAGSLFYNF